MNVEILNDHPKHGLKCVLAEDQGVVFNPCGTSSIVIIEGNPVESVKSFCYLGGVQDPSGRCSPDMLRQIGISASSMGSLSLIWRRERLSLRTNSPDVHRSGSVVRHH